MVNVVIVCSPKCVIMWGKIKMFVFSVCACARAPPCARVPTLKAKSECYITGASSTNIWYQPSEQNKYSTCHLVAEFIPRLLAGSSMNIFVVLSYLLFAWLFTEMTQWSKCRFSHCIKSGVCVRLVCLICTKVQYVLQGKNTMHANVKLLLPFC